MRSRVVFNFVGSFLQVYGVMLMLPVFVGLYYSEPFYVYSGFIYSALVCEALGLFLGFGGKAEDPSVGEAMLATVLGWVMAVVLGAIPLLTEAGLMNAVFETGAGLTTTGISMFLEPSELPRSILFWRSFMQWIGGLGILTFFIAVIRESGGVSRRLFSAEAHKTDSGSIRPSLTKSIFALWKVYGFLTTIIVATYIGLGMTPFNSLLHAFSAISTGGYSTMSASIAGFGSIYIEIATVLFMFVGGVNFVLLYRFLRADLEFLKNNSEFRLYLAMFLVIAGLTMAELLLSGHVFSSALLDSMFQSAAVISSTGYSTMSLMSVSMALQAVFIAVMFMGGSLGSTSGGIKVFRIKALMELVKVKIRSYSLPETAINDVKIDGEILENSTVRTISVLFFVWTVSVFGLTLLTLALEDVGFMAALSGSVSSIGNMGPVYMTGEEMVSLSPLVKFAWLVGMLAGRLEMLPVLAIFNSDLFKETT